MQSRCVCLHNWAERSAARSSRTNGQLSKLKSIKKRSPHICMFKGHFEVREVRLLWKRIASCALSGQGWPTEEA